MEALVHKVGKGHISAKVIADSISPQGVRIMTYELEYPRFIHAEFMTHRMISKNAASSRAIPVEKNIEMILARTAMPIHWGKNQPGMSAKEECDQRVWMGREGSQADRCETRENAWGAARNQAIFYAREFHNAGYHKQIVNRLLEPYTFMKVVATMTEDDNLFWLRRHKDAQPEFQELANVMWEAKQASVPVSLHPGWWHTPYFGNGFWAPQHADEDTCDLDDTFTLEDALAISASCCAQVSYRRLDDSLEKARDIFKRLVESKPVHASPFEHQATPINFHFDEYGDWAHTWEVGITHQDRFNGVWSGNFRGWIQHRQLIPDNVCKNYVPE